MILFEVMIWMGLASTIGSYLHILYEFRERIPSKFMASNICFTFWIIGYVYFMTYVLIPIQYFQLARDLLNVTFLSGIVVMASGFIMFARRIKD